ncbi:(2Fe-2S)-binding protein [Streptomyces palmae]|uniref:(2Fe-2S)-binding protein n=1 Tax=Streptomyces palmae TaxID=1701085 RepID=UPI001FD82BD7|nr:(2Fe-2S)-binding protein [Streptomyces palmae]
MPSDAATPALRARIEAVAAGLGTGEPRVAASLAFQGLAARLWSLGLGPAALRGQVPDLRPDGLWWNPDRLAPEDLWLPTPNAVSGSVPGVPSDGVRDVSSGAGPDPLLGGGPGALCGGAPGSLPGGEPRVLPGGAPNPLTGGTPDALVGRLYDAVLTAHLVPLLHATRAVGRMSEALLWGNAASALAGTARVLVQWCRDTGRQAAAERAKDLTRALLARPPLHRSGGWRLGPERDFRRLSCCLYYRVPGGGLCGDCALRRRPG